VRLGAVPGSTDLGGGDEQRRSEILVERSSCHSDGVSRRSGEHREALRNGEPLGDLDDDRNGAIRLGDRAA